LKLDFEEISYKYVNCHMIMYSDGLWCWHSCICFLTGRWGALCMP